MSTPNETPAAPAGTPPAAGTQAQAAPAAAPATPPAAAAPAAAAPTESKPAEAPAAPAAGKAGDPAQAGEKPASQKPPEQKAAVPEKYELKLPEGSNLNPAYVEKISSFAKENGLSNAQAQKVLERDHSAVAEMHRQHEEQKQSWIKASSEDPEIGGEAFAENAERTKRFFNEFFPSADIKKFLNESGFGNHPDIIRGFFRMAKLAGEDKFILPSTGSRSSAPQRTAEEIFYGKKPETPSA